MEKIGIICEYNPFHNGHVHHIKKIKEMYEDSTIILALGSNFLERGDVSIISKWNKTRIALDYGVDLVLEIPVLYGTNSADYFAYCAVKILNEAGVDKIVFGSESDDISALTRLAELQSDKRIETEIKKHLKSGTNYPTSLNRSLNANPKSNDILGIAYIKAIMKINDKIEPISIKRTNEFNDISSCDHVISATNIREKLAHDIPIDSYIPEYPTSMINTIDYDLLFKMLRYRILTEAHLERLLGVDEGIENRLKSSIDEVSSYSELLEAIKSKRYTESRLKRMLTHILLGIEKEDMSIIPDKFRILGFNEKGRKYLKNLDSTTLVYKLEGRIHDIELVASKIYFDLTEDESTKMEYLNRPIYDKDAK